jgi:DNA-binding NarL/FixJ family response regulator
MTDPIGGVAPGLPQSIVVLLVDDQPFVGAALRMRLAAEPDIKLHCCVSPGEAIALANQLGPALVFVDLVMPEMDGLTLVRAFRANPRTAGTPVVVLSANDDAGSRAGALAAGAHGFLVKLPATPELVACIRDHASRSASGKQTLDPAVMDVFHEADAPDFTRNLIDLFVHESGGHIETLKAAAARADGPTLTAVAHSLKGSSSIMGAARLAALCGRIEEEVHAASGSDLTPALVTAIDHEFAHVRHALAVQRERIGHS